MEFIKQYLKNKYLLVLANIIPLLAVVFLDWSVFEVLFVYFSETLIFFILSLIKIFFLKISLSSKIGNVLLYFFTLSIFVVFEGVVIFVYYIGEIENALPNANLNEILNIVFNPSYFGSLLVFGLIFIYYFYVDFILKQKYESCTAKTVIKTPAIRIWIMLIVALVGIGISKYFSSVYILLFFIIVKTWLDLLAFKDNKVV